MRVLGLTVSVPDFADDAGLETTNEMLPGERKTGSGEGSIEEAVLVATDSVVVAVVVAVSTAEGVFVGIGTETFGRTLAGAFIGTGTETGTFSVVGIG
jgi:hypothetical protein